MERTEGTKYQETKDFDIVDIAKLVRRDLREHYPNYKIRVQTERFANGASLYIQLANTGIERGTSTESDTKDTVRHIANQYNYNEREWQSDYRATKFYCQGIRIES